jgi:hypothetical protein
VGFRISGSGLEFRVLGSGLKVEGVGLQGLLEIKDTHRPRTLR